MFDKSFSAAQFKAVIETIITNHNEANPTKAFDPRAGDGSCIKIATDTEAIMPLVICSLSKNLVAVYHYYIQMGDVMYDPEIVFYITDTGVWIPYSYTQSGLGIYQETIRFKDGKPHMFMPKLIRSIKSFATTWARNIKAQGFVEAAKKVQAEE